MKKFVLLFAIAVIAVTIAALCILPASAATIDPATLEPGSDKVIFITDKPKKRPLPGDGSGTSPENPLSPYTHPNFEATDTAPKYHLNTAFYQAFEILAETGGTIVVMGPCSFGERECYGNMQADIRDVFTPEFGNNVIKITSVYNGVDYRKENGARLTVKTPANLTILGSTIWENIDIETDGNDRVISFSFYPTLIDEGVDCYPANYADWSKTPSRYISLAAGHRFTGGIDKTTSLLVRSGTYNVIAGGICGVTDYRSGSSTNNMDGKSSTKLVIEGTTKVLNAVVGSNYKISEFSGNTEIIINDGTFCGKIYGVSDKGMINTDGKVSIKINGGNFRELSYIGDVQPNTTKNLPAYSQLDLSGFKGDMKSLAAICKVIAEFTETTKCPGGATPQSIVNTYYEKYTPPQMPAATNKVHASWNPAPSTTASTQPETTAPSDQNNVEKEGSGIILYIAIGAAVAAIAAVTTVVLVMKKKKKA